MYRRWTQFHKGEPGKPKFIEFEHQGKTHRLLVSIAVNTFKTMLEAQPARSTHGARGANPSLTYTQATYSRPFDAPIHPSLEDRLTSIQQDMVKAV